jgi:hypothetical protein
MADDFRALRDAGTLPDWPDWCYLPLHGAYTIVSGGGRVPIERSHHIAAVGALAAWRMTQGIYRYDPALFAPLRETSIDRDLPVDSLYRLPEWCVYIETPDMTWEGRPLHGAWTHLDWSEHSADELRLLLDTAEDTDNPLDAERGLVPIPVILGAGGLAAALDRVIESSKRQAALHGYRVRGSDLEGKVIAPLIEPLLSLVLHLCAADAEIGDSTKRPADPQRVTGGDRPLPVARVTIWDVGVRSGAAPLSSNIPDRDRGGPNGKHPSCSDQCKYGVDRRPGAGGSTRAADPGASGLRPALGSRRRPELRPFGCES